MGRINTMECQFIGIGLRREGEKNGRKYDFVPCVIAFKDKNYEGYRAMEVIVDTPVFEGSMTPVQAGCVKDIEYHWYKAKDNSYKLQIDKVL